MGESLDSGALLETLCRQARELIGAADALPRTVRVRAGEMSVEVEYAEAPAAPPAAAGQDGAPGETAPATAGGHVIRAPLVGTFYRAPEPGADPFVSIGDEVEAGQQIGILEAMKLMNPVDADRAGRVVDILVPDQTPVDFDAPLLVLAPADS
ncbi:acetyl-CoA carboxylase biotin carboxyl carrier protein [Actinoallomurus sp. CA-142502]|uniref:acetyl-CoA carboxylase biotin carboxyl carrier protein n=1 Tax=Actinoallomurus sp. CA-142502 TaxID=3239885 RepID=UPI003D917A1D